MVMVNHTYLTLLCTRHLRHIHTHALKGSTHNLTSSIVYSDSVIIACTKTISEVACICKLRHSLFLWVHYPLLLLHMGRNMWINMNGCVSVQCKWLKGISADSNWSWCAICCPLFFSKRNRSRIQIAPLCLSVCQCDLLNLILKLFLKSMIRSLHSCEERFL